MTAAPRLGVNTVCHGQVVSVENTGRAIPDRLTSRQDHMQAIDREIRSFARLLDLPGMVVVVAADGKVVQQLELGHADVEANTQVTVNHLFLLASVTKTFTATLIMQMVDENLAGRVELMPGKGPTVEVEAIVRVSEVRSSCALPGSAQGSRLFAQ